MLIIEGPDGSGKTTLIQKIQERWPDLEVAPRVVTKDAEAMVDLVGWVNKNLEQGFQYKIFDRHRLISEFIYGPILRKDQQVGFNNVIQVWQWLNQFASISPVIIYCLPPLEVVRANIINDPTNSVVHDHVEAIYTAYVHRASIDLISGIFNTLVYDYTTDGQEDDPLGPIVPFINYAKGRIDYGI